MKNIKTKVACVALCAMMVGAVGCTPSKQITETAPIASPYTVNQTNTDSITPISQEVILLEGSFASKLTSFMVGKGQENIALSPYSAELAMYTAYLGANGVTQQEIGDAMGWSDAGSSRTKILAALKTLQTGNENRVFSSSTMALVNQEIKFQKAYEDSLKDIGASVVSFDFAKEQELLTYVNKWVSDNTNGKIDTLLDKVAKEDVAYLLNAIYFSSKWSAPFQTSMTDPNGVFHAQKGDVVVDMMHATITLPYLEDENAVVISMDFADSSSFVVMLPKVGREQEFQVALAQGGLDGWIAMQGAEQKTIDLTIPKFSSKQKSSLKDSFLTMGMRTAFSDFADFSPMIKEGQLAISDVLQNAYVSIDEQGAEAAAATAVIMMTRGALLSDMELALDRPFLYAIYNKEVDQILFTGWVADPS